MQTISPYKDFEFFLKHISFAALDYETIDKLIKFRSYGNEQGFLLLKENNIGQIDATPISWDTVKINDFTSEKLISTVALLLGEPIAYIQESSGQAINNIFPINQEAANITSSGYNSDLELHTENAFHKFSPDYLILLCLRQDVNKEAVTWISAVNNIIQILSPKEVQAFYEIRFNFLADYSELGKNARRDIAKWQPILHGTNISPNMTFDPYFMEVQHPADRDYLELFTKIAWQVATPVQLEAGDLLIIDNKRAAHARSKFTALHNGQDRWLQRMFVIKQKSQSDRLLTEVT